MIKIRRAQRKQAAINAKLESSRKEVEAAGQERGRTEQRKQPGRQSTSVDGETERQVHSRTSAGVSQNRRAAEKRRDKPFNDIKKLIQEARQPNWKAKATAARMLARMVESNRAMREARQPYIKCRANVRRERKIQLGRACATESIAAIKKWKMKCDRDQKHVTVPLQWQQYESSTQSLLKLKSSRGPGGKWTTVVVIADSGSGITIFGMVDVETAVKECNCHGKA